MLIVRIITHIPYFLSTLLDKDKEEVTEYFNNNGFERWNKIYSESDEVNDVQRDIRTGHGQTIEKVRAKTNIPYYAAACAVPKSLLLGACPRFAVKLR